MERKKFCISMITSAVLEGETTIGVVLVDRGIESLGDGRAYSGGEGRVRSNFGGDEEWSQWLGYVPIRERRGGESSSLSNLEVPRSVILGFLLRRK